MKPNKCRNCLRRVSALFAAVLVMFVTVFSTPVLAEEGSGSKWGDAADEIDKYLDAGFEYYLDGDTKSAPTTRSVMLISGSMRSQVLNGRP